MAKNPHHLIPGSFFTREQWEKLQPYIDELLTKPGGVLIFTVEVNPDTRNYPALGIGVFGKPERAALRRSFLAARRKAANPTPSNGQ